MIRVKNSRSEKLIIVLLREPFNPEICFIEYESLFPYFPSQSQPAIYEKVNKNKSLIETSERQRKSRIQLIPLLSNKSFRITHMSHHFFS